MTATAMKSSRRDHNCHAKHASVATHPPMNARVTYVFAKESFSGPVVAIGANAAASSRRPRPYRRNVTHWYHAITTIGIAKWNSHAPTRRSLTIEYTNNSGIDAMPKY